MPNETMDVSGSLKKIGKELLELKRDDPNLELQLEATAFLITYIANCLDVELKHAAERGRRLVRKTGLPIGPNGVRQYEIISGEDI